MSGAPSSWSTILPGLLAVFSAVSVNQVEAPGGGFDHEYVEWRAAWKDRKEANEFIHPGQGLQLLIKLTTCRSLGWDESEYTEKDTGTVVGLPATGITDVYQTQSGLRVFTIQAQCWTMEETDEVNGHVTIQRMLTRMDGAWARQQLLALNVDFTDVGPTRDMTATKGGHRWSVVSVDLTFTACIIETEPHPTGWIEKVIMTSHEQNNGVDVPASLRMVDEQLPPD